MGRWRVTTVVVVAIALLALGCGSAGDDATPTLAPPAGSVTGPSSGTTVAPATTEPATASTEPAPPPAPESTTAPTAPPAPAPLRNLPVVTNTITVVDATRPTVSRGRTIAASRTLTTVVVGPASGGPYPVVLFAHGFRLGPSGYRHLIDTIAAAGYVVAAPSFPLADAEVGGSAVDRADIPNQSGDLRVVLDRLLADPPPTLAGRIDGTRVAVVGHSDGADTALDLGYHRDRVDRRVQAVAALAPDAVPIPGGPAAAPPLLLVHGSGDSVVPLSESTTVFTRVGVPRTFVTLTGGDHLPPFTGTAPWGPVVDATLAAFLDRTVAGRAGEDPSVTAAVPGVATVRTAG